MELIKNARFFVVSLTSLFHVQDNYILISSTFGAGGCYENNDGAVRLKK